MLKKLWVLPVDIRLAAHSNKLRFRPRAYSYHRQRPGARRLRQADHRLGRGDEMAVRQARRQPAAAGGGAGHADRRASPSSSTAAGPVLFKQKRYGFNNELIEVYKFRSMYVDQCDATASKLVTKGDPRVTRVGRFIRKTSHRRTAAAVQRGVQGQPVAGRTAPARGPRQGREPPLRRGGGRLFRPPSRQARHHRLGPGQRLARRDRHPREDPAPRRARPLLHRELVGAVRPLHPGDDPARARPRPRTPTDVAGRGSTGEHGHGTRGSRPRRCAARCSG